MENKDDDDDDDDDKNTTLYKNTTILSLLNILFLADILLFFNKFSLIFIIIINNNNNNVLLLEVNETKWPQLFTVCEKLQILRVAELIRIHAVARECGVRKVHYRQQQNESNFLCK